MIKFKDNEYQCWLEVSLDLIGGKWKALILWYLGKEAMRFSELRKKLPHVTQKMLTQQLREMETKGLIHRHIYTQIPPKVEYSLTEPGKTLLPILANLCQWGNNYVNTVEPENALQNTCHAAEQ